jgi:hypothetical protein
MFLISPCSGRSSSQKSCPISIKAPLQGRSEGSLHISSESTGPGFSGIPLKVLYERTLRDKIIRHALPGSLSFVPTGRHGSFRKEAVRDLKVMWGPTFTKALSLLASSSASSTYVQYASSPPPSRLDIIFDLEMV